MRDLVTGSSGRIGTNLALQLLADGDFMFVDDCVDGIVRGVEALAAGRVDGETINLAYGQGNTLVRAAELIAAELGVEPRIAVAPSLVGEVTHYVADIRKAADLLGRHPRVPLAEGIPRAVAWFREHRAAHPEEDVALELEPPGGEDGALFKRASPPPG